jgi:DNA polymerase-3 subunit beta
VLRARRVLPVLHSPYYDDESLYYLFFLMRITCRKDTLAERLAVVGRAASTRAGMQVASGIRITATSGEEPLELAATDLELSLRVPAEAEQVQEAGSVVVPARLAQEVIRALPGDTVTLAADGPARLRVSSGSGEYALHAFPADDFPRLPEPDPERAFTLDRKAVVATIEQVARAASRDESRPVLTGVLVHFEAHALTMAATDSYRLAVREQPLEGGAPEPLEAIVPARALQEVARLAGSGEGGIDVVVQDNLVGFDIDGVQLTARRIDGQFPNFRSLLPDSHTHELTLPRGEVLDIVRRVGIFARQNAPVRVRLAAGELTISAQTPDVGDAKESLPTAFSDEPFEIGFNPDYLRDGIEAVGGDELVLRLISPLRPALLKGRGDDFWYLLMPIRLT